MPLTGQIASLATRIATEIKAVRSELTSGLSGKANTSHTHAGADIASGTVAYARLPVGTAASTVAAGNDARFTDARTPLAHVHSGADVTSGTLDAARLPTVLSPVRTQTYAASITVDPTVAGTNVSITATGDITSLAVSTTGAVNRQALEIVVLASGANRAVTFASAIRTSTSVTRGPYTIDSGQVGIFLVKYYALVSAWVLVAATESAT